ncbi:MAG: type IV secretory system conjugative DNA transfer family protein [Rhodanobacter sp.]|jgi:defect-in-organelle-trafficking protein DotC
MFMLPLDTTPMTLQQAQSAYQNPAYTQSVPGVGAGDANLNALLKSGRIEITARDRALIDVGLSLGVKAGMAAELHQIAQTIEVNERNLDTVYDFGRFMIQGRVVPPVITEARDLYNQDGDYTLRLSGALYKIESQARFSSVAPTWRDYLSFALHADAPGQAEYSTIIPKTGDEQQLWKASIADGWRQGVVQADLMFKHAMDRMNRDFAGMIRFHTFVVEGKLSMPAIASETIPVTREGQTMAVDETLFRITTLPSFNSVPDHWRGFVTPAANRDPVIRSTPAAVPASVPLTSALTAPLKP